MIEEPDVDQGQRLAQPPGDQFVSLAGFGDAGGVPVGYDQSGGIERQRSLHDFARINTRAVYRPAELYPAFGIRAQ